MCGESMTFTRPLDTPLPGKAAVTEPPAMQAGPEDGIHTCVCTRAAGTQACRNALERCPVSLTFGGFQLSSVRWALV